MTGIEQLRKLGADAVRGGEVGRAICDIADQIERERACDSDTIENLRLELGEARDDAAWVREHGGLDAVKRRWECLSYYADPVPRSCMEKRLARLQRQIDESHAALRRRRETISELNHRACDLTRENAELRKRAMPEGMEWLRYDTGEPVPLCGEATVTVHDEDGDFDRTLAIRSIKYEESGVLLEGTKNEMVVISHGERVKRPEPKVLDADGVEIREGDRVWSTQLDEPHEWIVIDPHGDRDDSQTVLVSIGDRTGHARPENLTHRAPVLAADGKPLREGETVWDTNGDELVIGAFEDGGHTVTCRYVDVGDAIPVHGMWSPSDLTHERPESWERIEEDAEKDPCDYFGFDGEETCGKCPASGKNCEQTMALDLVRRCRALAERERGE